MNNAADDLHPNWRALATIHLPLKRFIRAGEDAQANGTSDADGLKYEITGVSGAEVKEFYEQLVTVESNKNSMKKCMPKRSKASHQKKITKKEKFDSKKLFYCAQANEAESLRNFRITNDEINTTDQFGWTALMMAACEGATAAVEVLLTLGAKMDAKDKSGKTAMDLAKQKSHMDVVKLLENFKKPAANVEQPQLMNSQVESNSNPFYCDLCKLNFSDTTCKAHQTSTVHQFNLKSTLPENKLTRFNISQKNRGLQLMVKQGWNKESGLGPSQSGRLYPIKTVIRKQRTGLGVEQPPARVTHFGAFDERAVRRHNSDYYKKKPRNRNDIRREKVRDWKREKRLRRELS